MSSSRRLTIFFSAGEPSGDLHGANLIRSLLHRFEGAETGGAETGGVEAVGFGGPKMAAAGCRLQVDLTTLAVIGFLPALLKIHKFWRLYRRAKRFFRWNRPDAVVLIDFPGFNWWIARAAKKQGIPVFYYAPPQIWAWARWRVKKVRRFVDHVLCSLPFEQQWYAERGCNATLVGHPFFDEVWRKRLDRDFVQTVRSGDGPLVSILPGSRTQEVSNNLQWLLKAAGKIRAAVPGVRFAVAAFKPAHAKTVARQAAAMNLPVKIHVGKTPELIHAADCCLSVSGSVSLELLYHTKPTVMLYWMNRGMYFLLRRIVKVKYMTLVNLLSADDGFHNDGAPYHPSQPGAEKVLFPEYPTYGDKSQELASHVIEWLTDDERRNERVAQLAELKARVCHPGAAQNAADYILTKLNAPIDSIPRPHFLHQDVTDGTSLGTY